MEKIKIGIFGVGRGTDIAENFMMLNAQIVAICDFIPDRIDMVKSRYPDDVAVYNNFDEFIEHDMDAVVLANYVHEHAPFAIKCFEKGLNVYSECISNGTMAEGIELLDAFKKSDAIYMLAENYPQMKFNREMKRICDTGSLGKILYAEGEYNHPSDPGDTQFKKIYNYFEKHWRNYLPRTYYITHSLGPIMRATGATPKTVSALAAYAPVEGDFPVASYVGDRAAIITTQNDDGSIFRVTGCAAFGGHGNSYRVCGTKGQIENLRGIEDKVMLRYNGWEKPENEEAYQFYEPDWNDNDEELISKSGHGGGDYLTCRIFLDCIREGKQPEHPYNIEAAIAMSSVAILGHRSMLDGGKPYAIPDFNVEEDRELYKNDRLSPFYGTDGTEPTLPCSSNPDFKPTEKQVELYREFLASK